MANADHITAPQQDIQEPGAFQIAQSLAARKYLAPAEQFVSEKLLLTAAGGLIEI
jgi:hypothetical protein